MNSGIPVVRQRWINGLIIGFLVLTLGSAVTGKEFWPICNYPMFSGIEHRGNKVEMEFFVCQGGSERKLSFSTGFLSHLSIGPLLADVVDRFGVHSAASAQFLSLVLQDEEREWRAKGEWSDQPATLKVYSTEYCFPASGPPQPSIVYKTVLVEIPESRP